MLPFFTGPLYFVCLLFVSRGGTSFLGEKLVKIGRRITDIFQAFQTALTAQEQIFFFLPVRMEKEKKDHAYNDQGCRADPH